MYLINCNDWVAVHFENRTILRTDRNLYPEATWWTLISKVYVEPIGDGHYRAK